MSGFVYFLGCEQRFIKIGFAADVQRRMRAIQAGIPFEIVLISSYRGPRSLENAVHRHFARYRFRGDWFVDRPEIREMASVGPLATEGFLFVDKGSLGPSAHVLGLISAESARQIGVTRQAISSWRRKGEIPVERCPDVERATGIPRSLLRPDFWPKGDSA